MFNLALTAMETCNVSFCLLEFGGDFGQGGAAARGQGGDTCG